MSAEKAVASSSVNVNIGVLGHIDSGKTSLCKVLSTITSTASMDKHPQSQERGITLDLGFSSFSTDPPEEWKAEGCDALTFCLVDCPGHASLIRTVIGGAQIIDLCCLVVDANKGIQAQTAECLVVAEILANQLVIVLNKIDMIPEKKREKSLNSIIKKLRATFAVTKFGADLPFACVSANPQDGSGPIGLESFVDVLKSKLNMPKRDKNGPFMFSFDHAFPIKGQGTVITGTVLSGSVKPHQAIVIPSLGEAGKGKKVRSLQRFKLACQEAVQGDRVAMCVAGLDAKDLERGIVIGEKFPVPTLDACVCVVHRLRYFKHSVPTKARFHVTLGHQTVMATAHFFCPLDAGATPSFSSTSQMGQPAPASSGTAGTKAGKTADISSSVPSLAMGCGALVADRQRGWPTNFDFSQNYCHLDELFQYGAPVEYENTDGDAISIAPDDEPGKLVFSVNGERKDVITELMYDPACGKLSVQGGAAIGATIDSRSCIHLKDRDRILYLLRFLAQLCGVPGLPAIEGQPLCYALLVLEKPVTCPLGSLLIGSKLDFDVHTPNCRIAFFGRILTGTDPKELNAVKVVKMKSKTGVIDRFDKQDRCLMICKDMFTADTDMALFQNRKIIHEQSGAEGILEGMFGQDGKFKVRFKQELQVKSDAKGNVRGNEKVTMYFKRYNFTRNKGFQQ